MHTSRSLKKSFQVRRKIKDNEFKGVLYGDAIYSLRIGLCIPLHNGVTYTTFAVKLYIVKLYPTKLLGYFEKKVLSIYLVYQNVQCKLSGMKTYKNTKYSHYVIIGIIVQVV